MRARARARERERERERESFEMLTCSFYGSDQHATEDPAAISKNLRLAKHCRWKVATRLGVKVGVRMSVGVGMRVG